MVELTTGTTETIKALAPALSAGMAVQHANELLDPLISRLSSGSPVLKKTYMGCLSLLFGGIASWVLHLRLIEALTGAKPDWNSNALDALVTALVISTGTEGVNSVIKFLGYAKDQKKGAAANSESSAPNIQRVNREP